MARDIIITPKNQEPQIQFTGSGDVSSINLNVGSGISPVSGIREAGSGITTLSFEGTQGQLFSITDNLSSGTLFSVADITGLPLLEVDASGAVKIAEFGTSTTVFGNLYSQNGDISTSGNLGIGIASPATKLDIVGTSASDYAPTTVVSITGKTGSGTGWTGTGVESGYTHADGSVDALVTNITPIASSKYLVTFTISGISAGRFDHIDFGSTRVSVYKTVNGTFTVSFLTESSGTGGGDALELHPRSDFVGTVSIDSIKEVGVRDAVVNTRRSDGTIVNHIRTGPDSESVYIGFEAGESIPEGTPNNTAVGFRALRKNIQGSQNTAIGWMALTNAFDSWYNTAVGHNIFPSLKNPSNTYNTGMGTNIGISDNFTGSTNVLIGNNILRDATTATANVGLGYNALRYTTTGGYNTALGSNALHGNTTGSHNVAIGQWTLHGMTSGGQNIAMGRFAARYYGESTSVLTTANYSIFIGNSTKASGDSQTNQIVIGHEAVGNGSNSVTLGANTITKTVLNGDVGINTNSPDAKLHVVAANATDVGAIVKGASAHSASLSEWHASDGVVVASVAPDGSIASSGTISSSGDIISLGSIGINTDTPNDLLEIYNGHIRLRSNYSLKWQGDNNRIRGTSGGSGGGNVTIFAGGNCVGYFGGASAGGTGGLKIGGAAYSETDYKFEVMGSGAVHNLLASGNITVDGNIGVGNSNPADRLVVAGNLSTTHIGYTTNALRVTHNSNDTYLSLYKRADQSNAAVKIITGGDSYFNAGSVGIRTTSPDATLHAVAANATDVGIIAQGAAAQSANLTEWRASDDVVIAKVEPDGSIASSGDISASGTISAVDGDFSGTVTTDTITGGQGQLRLNEAASQLLNIWNAAGSIQYFSFRSNAFLPKVSSIQLGLPVSTARWLNVHAVGGSYQNLNVETGGSFKLFNLGDSHTNTTNTEFGTTEFSLNVLRFGTKTTGSGVARDVGLIRDGAYKLYIGSSEATIYQRLVPSADASYSLGKVGKVWSNVYSVAGNFSGTITNTATAGWSATFARAIRVGADSGISWYYGAGNMTKFNTPVTFESSFQFARAADGLTSRLYRLQKDASVFSCKPVDSGHTGATIFQVEDATDTFQPLRTGGTVNHYPDNAGSQSYRMYNLGEFGDADTEYLETSFDTNVLQMFTVATGAGVRRNLEFGNADNQVNVKGASDQVVIRTAGTAKFIVGPTSTSSQDLTAHSHLSNKLGSASIKWKEIYAAQGRFESLRTAVDVETSATVTMVRATDHTKLCDCTSNAITVNLDAANAGIQYTIKKTDASANAVTIDGFGAETIDGAATKVINTQYESVTIVSDGTNWFIV